MLNKEQLYTSTQIKLLHNLERLQEIQNGHFRPISIQLAPTDACSLRCNFCSVRNRENNELTLDQCTQILQDFKKIGAKTVELSGGGDPTMHKDINSIIEFAFGLKYDIGFITNGVKLSNVNYKNIKKLTWLRISLNCLDYVEDINIDIPDNVVLGFSYVWNTLSNEDTLKRVEEYYHKYNAKYVRVVPNCLSIEDIETTTKSIQPYLEKYPGFFFQRKKYTVPNHCWIGYVKPFINSDAFIYHCSASPLLERKFTEHFRMGHISEINDIWNKDKQFTAFNTCNCQEGKCFFAEHNDLIEQVISPCEHFKFV